MEISHGGRDLIDRHPFVAGLTGDAERGLNRGALEAR